MKYQKILLNYNLFIMGKMKELFIAQREMEAIQISSDEDYQYEMYRLQREMEEQKEKDKLKNKTNNDANSDRNSGTIS